MLASIHSPRRYNGICQEGDTVHSHPWCSSSDFSVLLSQESHKGGVFLFHAMRSMTFKIHVLDICTFIDDSMCQWTLSTLYLSLMIHLQVVGNSLGLKGFWTITLTSAQLLESHIYHI